MMNPINPQEPAQDIKTHLNNQGLKMQKKNKPGNTGDRISNGSNSGGGVSIGFEGNPNSKSSYDGIFGY